MTSLRAKGIYLAAMVWLAVAPAVHSAEPGESPRPANVVRSMTSRDLTPREKHVLAILQSGADELPNGVVSLGSTKYAVRNLEFEDAESCAQFNVEGATVFNRFDRFADVFVPVDFSTSSDVLADIRSAKGYVWDEFAGSVMAPPPPLGKKTTTRATPDAIVRGGAGKLTGKGTLFVVLDTGLDFFHPDFITYDEQGRPSTRLRCYWDTMAPWQEGKFGAHAPLSYPNGASLGTLYSREELNEALRSARPRFPVLDTDGHGTSCAGIAAGNGNGSDGRYAGVAPEADIIGVRLGTHYESAYLINAICDWVDKLAGDTPAVISCSFAAKDGGRDGMRIEERQLSARFPTSIKRRAICIAAGNEGYRRDHAEVTFGGSDDKAELVWSMDISGALDVYYDSADPDDLAYTLGNSLDVAESGNINPLTGKYVSHFEIPAGTGQLQLYSKSGKEVSADAYLYSFQGDYVGGFSPRVYTPTKKILSPGAATNAITVGSYDWNDQFEERGQSVSRGDPRTGAPLVIGALSAYSSAGPLRGSNVTKPDIVGPGQYFAASAARNSTLERDTTGWYCLFNGTSAATPYVAGVVCLIMEKKPDITLGEIKELLKKSATQDRQTGPLPNPRWGNGKLNVPAVERLLKELD